MVAFNEKQEMTHDILDAYASQISCEYISSIVKNAKAMNLSQKQKVELLTKIVAETIVSVLDVIRIVTPMQLSNVVDVLNRAIDDGRTGVGLELEIDNEMEADNTGGREGDSDKSESGIWTSGNCGPVECEPLCSNENQGQDEAGKEGMQ